MYAVKMCIEGVQPEGECWEVFPLPLPSLEVLVGLVSGGNLTGGAGDDLPIGSTYECM